MSEKTIFRTAAVTESSTYSATPGLYPGKGVGDLEGIGTVRQVGNYFYRWVQNTYNVELKVGDVVFHDPSDGDDMVKYVENGAAAPVLSYMAGVVASTTIAASTADGSALGGYGWIMIEGYTTAYLSPTTSATVDAGGSCVGADGLVYVNYANIIAVGTPSNYQRHLVMMEDLDPHTTPAATLTACWVACRG